MRLVGIALLTAWLLAWAAAPQSSLLGGVAAAGGDRAAVAWLELRHEPGAPAPSGALHVATVDEAGRVAPRLAIGVGADAVAFRLADAGEGRFVLAAEYRNPARRWFEVHRIGPIGVER